MAWRTFAEITSSQATVITEDSGDQVYCIPFSWLDDNFTYLKDRIYTGSGSPVGIVSPEQDKAWYLDTSSSPPTLWFWNGSSWTEIDYVPATVSGTKIIDYTSAGILTFPKQSACCAYLSADQSITANTATKVALDTALFDIQNEFDSTNNRITVTEDGIYAVIGQAEFDVTAAGDVLRVYIYVNGGAKALTGLTASDVSYHILSVMKILELNAGDYVELYVKNVSSDDTIISGSAITYLCVAKIA